MILDLSLLPLWYQYSVVFVFGLIIGSFLNVVIYRLHTGRSLNGQSHCMSCGKILHWYELIPLVSYLVQSGRCRSCSSYVPIRYLWCELLTASLFVIIYQAFSDPIIVVLSLVLVAVLVITFFYDYYHLIIPNLMVTMTTVLVVLILLYNFWQNGEADWLSHLLSGVGAFVFFGGLWVVSKGRWIGLGDAKLAFPLATLLGPSGAFTFVVGSFWVGSIISLGIMGALYLYKRGQPHLPIRQIHFTIKSEVPFAPFIIISFIIVYAFSFDVLEALDWFLL